MVNYKTTIFLFGVLASGLFSCSTQNDETGKSKTDGNPVSEEYKGSVVESQKQKFGIDTIATGLTSPWGLAFLPDGRILINEKEGVIKIIQDGKLLDETVQGVPEVYANGQGGLLDIKLHPDYENNGWIYLTYAKPGEGGGGTTLARTKLEGTTFTGFEELFSVDPFVDSNVHFGSRIAFDGKGYMFVSTGERGTKPNAQDLSNHHGKILRFHDDGKVPTDNPFVNTANVKPEIWSYGHRNVQGMIYDFANDILWAQEHGPKGGDEVNLVEPGKNYGWPEITYGIDYDGSIISDKQEQEGMQQPIHYWDPSIAPCGMTIVTSDKYPQWKGNLLVGALAHQHVARIELNDREFAAEEKLLDKVGRVRAVVESPDGYIYVTTEGTGLLLKLIPINN